MGIIGVKMAILVDLLKTSSRDELEIDPREGWVFGLQFILAARAVAN